MGRDAAQTEDGRDRLLVEAVTDYAIWVLILIVSHDLGLRASSRRGIGVRQIGAPEPMLPGETQHQYILRQQAKRAEESARQIAYVEEREKGRERLNAEAAARAATNETEQRRLASGG
jgi:hypothetical protein